MQFTRIPQQYSPLGGELRYAVSQEAAGNIDIRIVDAAAGAADGIGAAVSSGGANSAGKGGPAGDGSALLGAKRFAAVVEAAFDAAPYLRRRLHFTPATGRTGFYPAEGRTVTVVVEAVKTDGETAPAVAPARMFLPGEAPGTPGLQNLDAACAPDSGGGVRRTDAADWRGLHRDGDGRGRGTPRRPRVTA